MSGGQKCIFKFIQALYYSWTTLYLWDMRQENYLNATYTIFREESTSETPIRVECCNSSNDKRFSDWLRDDGCLQRKMWCLDYYVETPMDLTTIGETL
ncbi:hypothetical protein Zmor_018835 [Zophobas morio]|uniref:Uncharacterized protein n=1 Tax=Zophobas morio TaxID=2755281 RepID=A0AA38MDI3_9CUCU|nr:hypothetical protein Zmor_018835 [Zophobas morio]